MNSLIRLFLRSLEVQGLQRLVSGILLVGLMFMFDGFLLLFASSFIGGLYGIAATALFSLLGALVVGSSFRRHSKIAKEAIGIGRYPKGEFVHLSALFISLILITIPGFFTSLAGGLIYIPPVRKLLGIMLHEKFKDSFEEIYNFSRVQED